VLAPTDVCEAQKTHEENWMIITVTLNAAIDKSLSVPNFRLGRRHRTVEQRTMAGGKGVNIARTLKALGQPVIATGLAGGATGTHIVEQLTEESILNDFVRIREESRTNTSVLDPTDGQQTEINERGPAVSEREMELFRDKLFYLARGAAIVVFAGSIPHGVEPDIYATLIRGLQRMGVTTVIDTDGDPMRQAVRAEPHVVSPNVLEAEELVGHEFGGDEERSLAVREIAQLGPREAIMTLPDGCFAQVLIDGQPRLLRARIEPREPVATRGSGDAFLAGYVAARYNGRSPEECLRSGVACGAESTGRLGAGLIDRREVHRLENEVELSAVELPAEVGG
jgi:1-phosphofructokinase family hexose kinase